VFGSLLLDHARAITDTDLLVLSVLSLETMAGGAEPGRDLVSSDLPPKPDFAAIEAEAPASANRRTFILGLIGNLVFNWSNNESLFIYILMLLLNSDQASAAIVFATLNTTRARLDLVQRLAKLQIRDRAIAKALTRLIERFNECTRIRNEFNHCMYTVDAHGQITHTHSIRIVETRNRLQFGELRPVDDLRIKEMIASSHELKKLNRDIWDFLPRLQEHLARVRQMSPATPIAPDSSKS
jgi:hypothetical protein